MTVFTESSSSNQLTENIFGISQYRLNIYKDQTSLVPTLGRAIIVIGCIIVIVFVIVIIIYFLFINRFFLYSI